MAPDFSAAVVAHRPETFQDSISAFFPVVDFPAVRRGEEIFADKEFHSPGDDVVPPAVSSR